MLKLRRPQNAPYKRDVHTLFWNGTSECLGVVLLRGRGRLIVLPKFQANEDVIDTFMHRVVPQIYKIAARDTLTNTFNSPAETATRKALKDLLEAEQELNKQQEAARVALASANREKINVIDADETAKQIQLYYDHALRQDDAALYYLYKIVEVIGNKFGGEASGIKAVGEQVAWKAIKRLANESYRDARHAPKAGDVIKKWTNAELNKCFQDTKTVVLAYFSTLF